MYAKEGNSSAKVSEEKKQSGVSSVSAPSAEKKVIQPSRGDSPDGVGKFIVSATAYTAYCAGCSGITATGINLIKNPHLKVIAVDPNVIPLGSKVHVEGYGYAIAGDTGGAIKGNKIDLFIPDLAQAKQWGRKSVTITILK